MARSGTVTAEVAASAALDAAGNSSTEASVTDNTVVYTDGTGRPRSSSARPSPRHAGIDPGDGDTVTVMLCFGTVRQPWTTYWGAFGANRPVRERRREHKSADGHHPGSHHNQQHLVTWR